MSSQLRPDHEFGPECPNYPYGCLTCLAKTPDLEPPDEEPPTVDDPDEERITYIATENGFWQILPPQPLPDPVELTDEERREATQRYIEARYGKVIRGNYTSMVHRETDGSDPLVEEPGP